MLKTYSFTLSKGTSLSQVDSFIQSTIGYDAFLIKDLQAERLNNKVVVLTIIYESHPLEVLDSMAPKPGGIFTSSILGNATDARLLFSSPVDPGSLESGTFLLDGVGLGTGSFQLVPDTNRYLYQVDISTANASGYHELQVDSSKLTRVDGSYFKYSPLGGYVVHGQSSAHLGDPTSPLEGRRRGLIKSGHVRTSKGQQVHQVIAESLRQQNLDTSTLLNYVVVAEDNNIDVYFLYLEKPEPQVVQSFPFNNALYPNTAVPDNITFIFNTEIDSTYLTNNVAFKLISDYNTTSDINISDVSVFEDNRTVKLDLSTYLISEGIYSILLMPGIRSRAGFIKEKPEIWTIHVNTYEGTSGSVPIVDHGELAGLADDDHTQYILRDGTRPFTGPVSGDTPTVPAHLATKQYVDDSISASSSGASPLNDYITWSEEVTLPNSKTLVGLDGITVTLGDDPVSISWDYLDEFTGHTGNAGIHYEMSAISITESQISDFGDYVTQSEFHSLSGDFSGHSGNESIHYTQTSIDHGIIAGLADDDHPQYSRADGTRPFTGPVSGQAPTQGAHLATKTYVDSIIVPAPVYDSLLGLADASQAGTYYLTGLSGIGIDEDSISGAVVIYANFYQNYLDHTGDTSIHYEQSAISITESQISDLGNYVTQAEFDSLSGDYSGHTHTLNELSDVVNTFVAPVTGKFLKRIGSSWDAALITESDISDLQDYALDSALTSLSNIVTGHTGDSSIHFTQAQISITESQISDLGDYALNSKVNSLSGYAQSHIDNTSNPHSVTYTQVGAPSLAAFTGHTGDSTIHFTQAEISITESQISDLQSYLTGYTETDPIFTASDVFGVTSTDISNWDTAFGWGDHAGLYPGLAVFTGHTGNANVHFTQAEISITESQISDLGDYATNTKVDNLSGYTQSHISNTSNPHSVTAAQVGAPTVAQFTGHTGDSNIHFTQSQISITESQISDLGNYLENVDGLSGDFTGHSGNSSIHFTQAEISITESQISDLGDYVSQAEFDSLSGSYTDHSHSLNQLTDVANTFTFPSTGKFLKRGGSEWDAANITEADIVDLQDYALDSKVDSLSGYVNSAITAATGAIDHGNIGGLLDDDHTQYLRVDGSRALGGSLDVNGHDLQNVNELSMALSTTSLSPSASRIIGHSSYNTHLQQINILDGSSSSSNLPTNFRFDLNVLAYANQRIVCEAESWDIIYSGGFTGLTTTEKNRLFTIDQDYINLYSFYNSGEAMSITITGMSESNSSNTRWWPFAFWHSSASNVDYIKLEIQNGNYDWETTYEGYAGNSGQYQNMFPFIASVGVLRGARWTFSGITNNVYLRTIGVFAPYNDPYAWNLNAAGNQTHAYKSLTLWEGADFQNTLNMNSNLITNVSSPISDYDAANKTWVTSQISSATGVYEEFLTTGQVTPLAPSGLSLSEIDGEVSITFSGQNDGITQYEIWQAEGSPANYQLIGMLAPSDTASEMSVLDNTYVNKTGIYYEIYSSKYGLKSAALTGFITVTGDISDITDLEVIPHSSAYSIHYSIPSDRRFKEVVISKDAQTTTGALDELNSIPIYTGRSDSFTYNVPYADIEKYHQFWVSINSYP